MNGATRRAMARLTKEKRQMAITRFDPFRDLAVLHDRMNRLLGDAVLRSEDDAVESTWVPPVDVYETVDHGFVLSAELPDMNREEIDVKVEDNRLTLSGTRTLRADVAKEQYRRVERSYGRFSRSFTLPNTVDASKVSAEYKGGVLTIKMPFREDARPRTINVEVAA